MKKGNIHKVATKKIVTIAALTILALHSSLFFLCKHLLLPHPYCRGI